MNIKSISNKFRNDHLGKGEIKDITEYSFTYSTNPDKNGKTESVVYMLSYFLDI